MLKKIVRCTSPDPWHLPKSLLPEVLRGEGNALLEAGVPWCLNTSGTLPRCCHDILTCPLMLLF